MENVDICLCECPLPIFSLSIRKRLFSPFCSNFFFIKKNVSKLFFFILTRKEKNVK